MCLQKNQLQGTNLRILGWDFRITLLSSCSDMGQTGSRTEDDDKPERTTGEEGVGLSRSD